MGFIDPIVENKLVPDATLFYLTTIKLANLFKSY
jgi:hypothetical protein